MDDNKKKPSISEKIKEGVSVHELETFARKYTIETFVILAIIIASISGSLGFFYHAGWSLALAGIGAIISIAFPEKVIKLEGFYYNFIIKQEKIAQIAIGVVQIVIALFVPFILFAQIGLLSGIAFHHFSTHPRKTDEKEVKSPKAENEEEHI